MEQRSEREEEPTGREVQSLYEEVKRLEKGYKEMA